jgi:pilus assembly protein CpaF
MDNHSLLNTDFQSAFEQIENKVKISKQLEIASLPEDTYFQKQEDWVEDLITNEIDSVNLNIKQRMTSEFLGHGPLDDLFQDSEVTEIIVNGPNHIAFEKNGTFYKHSDKFYSELTFNNFIQRLCDIAGVVVSLNQPCMDFSYDLFRVHLIQPPLSKDNTCICFRRHPDSPWNLKKLGDQQWATKDQLDTIRYLVQNKKNILIIGSTGTGKTSVLNACLQELSDVERVVTIEDTHEIKLPNKVSTKLLTRHDSNNQLQNFDQGDLVKQALRMRPQRLIMGEIRGAEAKDYLMALSTGHEGSICTLHANNAQQALMRLEMLIQIGAPYWNTQTIRRLIQLSLSHIILLKNEAGHRKLDSIYKISSLEEFGFLLDEVSLNIQGF